MPTRLDSVVFDAVDPVRLARFWADALGWHVVFSEPDEVVVEPEGHVRWGEGGTPHLVFVPGREPKTGKNRVHVDLASGSLQAQAETATRLVDLGARAVDIGQGDVPWTVLADPEGNELCVLDPREAYRDTGPVAAVVIDCADPARLVPFWSAASGWPVAGGGADHASLRHPSAAGTHLELLAAPGAKTMKSRVHLDVAPEPEDDHGAAVRQLEAVGGRRIDIGQGDVTWVVLADAEGNELCVLTPR